MMNHSGILGNILAHGIDSDEHVGLHSGRQLTQQDVLRLSEQAASQWRDAFANLLSVFELNGDFGLWSVLGAFYQTNALPQSVTDAVTAGDAYAFTTAMYRAQCATFVTLFDKNALARLQLVENLPAEALADYSRMRQVVASATKRSAPTVAQAAPVASVAVETPTETCARDWKELSGDKFKAKYMNNRNNRPIYEQALTEGKI